MNVCFNRQPLQMQNLNGGPTDPGDPSFILGERPPRRQRIIYQLFM